MREKVLIGGEMSTSKTMSLVTLAVLYPDSKTVILDPDDGVEKVLEEIGYDGHLRLDAPTAKSLEYRITRDQLPALTVLPLTPDWAEMINRYQMVKAALTPQDWLCMDMMGRFWDFSQNYYSRMVFGQSPSEHLMTLRNQAKAVNFGGFDGLTDWTIIKRMHNEELVDDALLWSHFNVMATTSLSAYLPVEKIPTTGIEGFIAQNFRVKLEGEKHNLYRFDTIAVMNRKLLAGRINYTFRLAKDKGRAFDVNQEFNITGSNFWQAYCQYRGVSL